MLVSTIVSVANRRRTIHIAELIPVDLINQSEKSLLLANRPRERARYTHFSQRRQQQKPPKRCFDCPFLACTHSPSPESHAVSMAGNPIVVNTNANGCLHVTNKKLLLILSSMRAEGIAMNNMETGVLAPSPKYQEESFRPLSRMTMEDRSEIRHILYLFAFGSVDFISIRYAWRRPSAFNQNIKIIPSIKHSYAVNIQMVDSEKLSDELSLLLIAHWISSSKQTLRSQQSKHSWIKPPTVPEFTDQMAFVFRYKLSSSLTGH